MSATGRGWADGLAAPGRAQCCPSHLPPRPRLLSNLTPVSSCLPVPCPPPHPAPGMSVPCPGSPGGEGWNQVKGSSGPLPQAAFGAIVLAITIIIMSSWHPEGLPGPPRREDPTHTRAHVGWNQAVAGGRLGSGAAALGSEAFLPTHRGCQTLLRAKLCPGHSEEGCRGSPVRI